MPISPAPEGSPVSGLRYRRLFESAPDGILIVNPETKRIIDVNPFLADFLGYTYDEFIGKELFEIGLFADETARASAFHALQTKGHVRYENLPLETRDGRIVAAEFVSCLYQEGDHPVIQCNIRDNSARSKSGETVLDAKGREAICSAELEAVVNHRLAELQLSNAQLETFVYTIAHDLRAPLRTMQGFARLLIQDHSANLDQSGRNYANFIDSAAQTMDRLLADLLAFSHISQQRIELAPIALGVAVQSALLACETEIRERRASVVATPPWPVVLAHSATLRQVLVNLIENALKFVADRAPQVRLRAEIRAGGIIRVWVEDNGIGIAAEFHERIFQLFQRLHTTAYAGTGIGLAIVQRGVERMRGRTGVESTPGIGSNFWFELSQAPSAVATKVTESL